MYLWCHWIVLVALSTSISRWFRGALRRVLLRNKRVMRNCMLAKLSCSKIPFLYTARIWCRFVYEKYFLPRDSSSETHKRSKNECRMTLWDIASGSSSIDSIYIDTMMIPTAATTIDIYHQIYSSRIYLRKGISLFLRLIMGHQCIVWFLSNITSFNLLFASTLFSHHFMAFIVLMSFRNFSMPLHFLSNFLAPYRGESVLERQGFCWYEFATFISLQK